jgi:hypothetical protein
MGAFSVRDENVRLYKAMRMKDQTAAHPAKYSKGFTEIFRDILSLHLKLPWKYDTPLVLDPFAGVGGVHELRPQYATFGVEIEEEWASASPYTFCADSTSLPIHWTEMFQAVVTSPTYGNRMADHHKRGDCTQCNGAGNLVIEVTQIGDITNQFVVNKCPKCDGTGKESSKRNTYTHVLGRDLHPNNTGGKQFTDDSYKDLHLQVYKECRRVLEPGGLMVVNVSDHIRKGQRVPVVQWHKETLSDLRFRFLKDQLVNTQRFGFGENREQRVETESILIFRREL